MTYKIDMNQTVFVQDEDQARQLAQYVDYLTGDKDKNGGIRLYQQAENGFKELPVYSPVSTSRATSMRQECHTTVLSVIKELSTRFEDTQFGIAQMTEGVVSLPDNESIYFVDYKALYQNFVEVVGTEHADEFKEAVSTVLTAQSLRGIKGIKI